MQAYLKKLGYFALILGGLAMVFSATGCTSSGELRRPGWIVKETVKAPSNT